MFSWSFLDFAAKHHLLIDKYWHNLPSWRFSFRHPKGGFGGIEVFKEGDEEIKVSGYWWLDDYDKGIRRGRRHESGVLNVNSFVMLDLLEDVLNKLVSWPLDSWTEEAHGLGDSWKKHFCKEEFERIYDYPNLKLG